MLVLLESVHDWHFKCPVKVIQIQLSLIPAKTFSMIIVEINTVTKFFVVTYTVMMTYTLTKFLVLEGWPQHFQVTYINIVHQILNRPYPALV